MAEPIALLAPECVVRNYMLDDAASLARHGNNRKIWLNLRDRFPHPYTEHAARGYITYNLEQQRPTSFAIEVDGSAVGGISLRPGEDIERRTAEMGYWLGEEYWGRGIVTAAIRLVTEYAFGECDLDRVFAVPFVHNEASWRALEKAGYAREGLMRKSAIKDGVVYDQYLYARVRD
jgi:[ribosomal protein S5]-alanine N-acetyltransferase